MDHKLHK